jgi:phage terminase large subunit-like protein
MVEQSAELRSMLRILRSTHRILRRDDPDSFIAAIAADGDLTDGVNPACVIADEIHRWHTRKHLENWDVLALGGIARQHSLIIALTTAGTMDDSPLAWRYHEKTLKVAQGVISDPHFYGRRYGAEAGDDWEDERTWIKANPSLIENGGFLPIDKIRTAYLAAQSNPEDQRAFRRYYLNIWDQRDERAIDMKIWDECASGLKPPRWPVSERDMERLRSVPLYIGVDISLSTDLTAVVLLFLHEDKYEVVPFFWLPEDAVRKRELRDGVPYSAWAHEGFLETCPGSAIDPRLIRQRIEWAAEHFDLREVCFDPYNSREISLMLQDAGIKCVEIRQTYSGVSEATKKLLHLVATRRLDHRDHPVLRWNASCLSIKSDGNDLIRPSKPDRERDSSRIDGISALIDALARAMLHEDKSVDVKVI